LELMTRSMIGVQTTFELDGLKMFEGFRNLGICDLKNPTGDQRPLVKEGVLLGTDQGFTSKPLLPRDGVYLLIHLLDPTRIFSKQEDQIIILLVYLHSRPSVWRLLR
jgi:hypothetical protein